LEYPAYLLARFVLWFFRALPRSIALSLIRMLAACVYFLDSRHRRIAAVNLRIAFPDMPERSRGRIARRSFQNTAMNLLEVSRLSSLNHANISSLVEYDKEMGLNNYFEALSKGKGLLYLTGHFSSWELLPIAHALHGYPLSFITRPLDNSALEQYIHRLRESKGNEVITRRNSSRSILKKLNSNGAVGILMDQNTTFNEGIFVDFFGLPAMTTTSVARFAIHTDAPILPGYLTPMHKGRYKIKFLPPVNLMHTGDMDRDTVENTRLLNEVLENIIREQPESWLWGHKRWKNQPPGNPQNLYNLSDEELQEFLNTVDSRQRIRRR
jgi:Kdo2-lipid IVA lauroyltransferase/acyltransferase